MGKKKRIKLSLSTIVLIVVLIIIIVFLIFFINNSLNTNKVNPNENIKMNANIENEDSKTDTDYHITNTYDSYSVNNTIEKSENYITDQIENSNDDETDSNDINNSIINETNSVKQDIILKGKYYLSNSDNYYIFYDNGNVTFSSEDLLIEGTYKVIDNKYIEFTEIKRKRQDPDTGEISEEDREETVATYILNNENSFTVYEEGNTYTYVKE